MKADWCPFDDFDVILPEDEDKGFEGVRPAYAPADARSLVPDHFLDHYPHNISESKIVHDFAYDLMGQFRNPKMMKTVRKRLLSNMMFLRILAELHPDVFDELICAYAERALLFEYPNAA